jgi:hypothetical protein
VDGFACLLLFGFPLLFGLVFLAVRGWIAACPRCHMPFARVLTNRTLVGTKRMRGLKRLPVDFNTQSIVSPSGERSYSETYGGVTRQVDFERDSFEDTYRCRRCGHEWMALSHTDRTTFEV